MAQEPALDSGNTAWMLTSTALVLMMTVPGLAMFYGGMVRKKNVLTMAMQVFAICCLITLVWMVAGYSLAFSGEGRYVGDLSRLFLGGMAIDSLSGTIPESVFMTFQMTFAIITPALITGAFADRMKFSALLWFMGLWGLLVYAPIAHWVWGAGGWILQLGALDFAGGTVVHINCGIAGLVTALVLGKRLGYGVENMAPHNLSLSVIGASLLVGRLVRLQRRLRGRRRRPRRHGHGGDPDRRRRRGARLVVRGVVAARQAERARRPVRRGRRPGRDHARHPASSARAAPWSSASRPACSASGRRPPLKRSLGYDDALDAFGIHGVGGIVGAILTGVFAVEAIGGTPGALEGNVGQIVTQIYSVLATLVWSGAISFVILKVIDATIGLRVAPEIERDSLDVQLHGETVQ